MVTFFHFLAITHSKHKLVYEAIMEQGSRGPRRMANVMDKAAGISDVDMTENRDISDHPWSYVREELHMLCL